MGCDIHSFCELYDPATGRWNDAGDVFPLDEFNRKWYKKEFGSEPFADRNYGLFGFLADVRNYAYCDPLSPPRGVPDDWNARPMTPVKDDDDEDVDYGFGGPGTEEHHWESCDYHSHSWFLLSELLDFDYDKTFWNRRVTRQITPNFSTGAGVAEPGEGTTQTYRDLVCEAYFQSLDIMKKLGPPEHVRVVFYFDN